MKNYCYIIINGTIKEMIGFFVWINSNDLYFFIMKDNMNATVLW